MIICVHLHAFFFTENCSMAQRIVHYLIADRLSEEYPVYDRQRFLTGSLLPDAYRSVRERDITHYKVSEGDIHYSDFRRFREEYRDRILHDDLYLGYYLHLAEDALYRRYLRTHDYRRPMNLEQRGQLHQDYHILNSLLIAQHGLRNELTDPIDLSGEPISRILSFQLPELISGLDNDFHEQMHGQCRYVTPDIINGFIAEAYPLCAQEMSAVRNGHFILEPRDYAYRK